MHTSTRPTRHPALLAALFAVLAVGMLAPATPALAAVHAKGFRVGRTCRLPSPGKAACLAMRLLPDSLTPADLAANRAAYRRAARRGQRVRAANEGPDSRFFTPTKLHAAYTLPTGTTGATQTIAVVDAFDDPTAESDLAVYDETFGLGECTTANGCFKKVNQTGKAGPLPAVNGEWASEISIDVQMARAICQNCHVLLVEADSEEFSDLGAGVNAAVAAGATVVSNSYGGPDLPEYASIAAADYNHPGVVVTASSGDCGYLNHACSEAKKANFPSSFQDVVAVGGTSLFKSGKGWTSSVWSGGGSGCSAVFSAPLWQSTLANFSATGCAGGRAVADISAIGDPNTGVDIYDSTPEELGAPTGWGVWGGTSVASPIVASAWGLAGGSQGVSYPAETLYAHFGQASNLYDVVSGSNGACGSATICKAAVGFDGPTGVGSPLGLGAFAAGEPPHNTSLPAITGSAVQDSTLTASPGEWTGEPTSYAYQWERCSGSCSSITGATSSTYTLTAADVGRQIRVSVTAANTDGSGPAAFSAETSTVLSNELSIGGFTPSSGITGSSFTVQGSGLDTSSQVLLGKLPASFTALSPTELEVTVPDGAVSGKLAVTTAHGSAKTKAKFIVTLTVKSFKPAGGAPGTTVTIKGVGFNSSSTVAFNGTAATVLNASATRLKVTVPAGATTGRITVTNSTAPLGTVRSASAFTP